MEVQKAISILNSGGIGVIPTDTLYGIVGRADMPSAIQRIYELKDRNQSKPFIILMSSHKDLETFGVDLSMDETNIIEKIWPGKVSVILKVDDQRFNYLTRGKGSLAFRMPYRNDLIEILKQTGPLVAPSTNPEGKRPAETIEEAKEYFNDMIDFYLDGGELKGEPSTLITLVNGKIEILRQGSVKIETQPL